MKREHVIVGCVIIATVSSCISLLVYSLVGNLLVVRYVVLGWVSFCILCSFLWLRFYRRELRVHNIYLAATLLVLGVLASTTTFGLPLFFKTDRELQFLFRSVLFVAFSKLVMLVVNRMYHVLDARTSGSHILLSAISVFLAFTGEFLGRRTGDEKANN